MEILNNIPNDKLLHSFYGAWIYILASSVLPSMMALALVVVIATGKEIYDKVSGKGTPELLDAIFTISIPLALVLIERFIK